MKAGETADADARNKREASGAFADAVTATRDSVLRSPNGARWWRIRAPSTIEGSADRGATWTVEFSDPTAHIVRGVVSSNDGCWMIGENGLVLRLRPGTGAGWLRVTPPSTRPLVSVTAVDARIATIADDSGRRYRTTDGGQTWQVVQP